MTDKFKNKYRISSARLHSWDYSSNGAYFITICTQNREHFFGNIVNGEMQLNEIGKILEQQWIKTPELRPDMNLELDVFAIMPNHFHGIIIIGENQYNGTDAMHCVSTPDTDAMHCVSTITNKFGSQSKNLASIIRGIKSSVTMQAKKSGNKYFAWQPRYHDHIIHDTQSFERIRNYIKNNPLKWNEDKFYE
ncbi:MAG: transposase [Bacteroidota bacterium]